MIRTFERIEESISDFKEILKCDKYKLDKDEIKYIKHLIEKDKEELKLLNKIYKK